MAVIVSGEKKVWTCTARRRGVATRRSGRTTRTGQGLFNQDTFTHCPYIIFFFFMFSIEPVCMAISWQDLTDVIPSCPEAEISWKAGGLHSCLGMQPSHSFLFWRKSDISKCAILLIAKKKHPKISSDCQNSSCKSLKGQPLWSRRFPKQPKLGFNSDQQLTRTEKLTSTDMQIIQITAKTPVRCDALLPNKRDLHLVNTEAGWWIIKPVTVGEE